MNKGELIEAVAKAAENKIKQRTRKRSNRFQTIKTFKNL
jgi:hypothetical protein